MKSPFPGMDPYIEASPYWGDFHDGLIALIQQHLADTAPDGYFVHLASRDYIEVVEQEGKESQAFVPDVSVRGGKAAKKPKRGGSAAVAEPKEADDPITLRAFVTEQHREKFVEVYEHGDEPRLVTAIEVLSPSNKKAGSPGQAQYLRKRQSLLLGDVHLVELDLLRGGERMPMRDPWPDSPYVLTVARVDPDHRCQVWRGHSDRPLPPLPVPLIEPKPDLGFDLQSMVDTLYRRGKYGELLDYSKPPAALSAGEVALVRKRLKSPSK